MFPLLALALVILPFAAAAEEISLEEALRQAVSARPFAQAARLEADAARAAVGEARSLLLPRLVLTESLVWTDEPAGSLFITLNQEDLELAPTADAYNFPPSRRDFETRLTLRQPLFDPDLTYRVRRTQTAADAAGAKACRSAEEAAFAAFRAYLGVQQARAALEWAASSRREAEEISRLSGERHEAGIGLKADVLRARVSLSEAERRTVTAENDLEIARQALALAIGLPPGAAMDIAAPVTSDALAPTTAGPLRRGDLQALSLQTREAVLAHAQSRAAWLPRLELSASYALHDAGAPFGTDAGAWTVRAGMNWEIFDGRQRHHATERTAAAERAAEARHREGWRQALFAAEEARRRGEEARLHLATAQEAISAAEEGYRLLVQRFEAGLIDLGELLSARTAFDRARLDRIQAETRYLLAQGNERFQQGTFLENLFSCNKEMMP